MALKEELVVVEQSIHETFLNAHHRVFFVVDKEVVSNLSICKDKMLRMEEEM